MKKQLESTAACPDTPCLLGIQLESSLLNEAIRILNHNRWVQAADSACALHCLNLESWPRTSITLQWRCTPQTETDWRVWAQITQGGGRFMHLDQLPTAALASAC